LTYSRWNIGTSAAILAGCVVCGLGLLYAYQAGSPAAKEAQRFAASITEPASLRLKADFLNAFNHTNLGGLVADVANTSFGPLTSASARTMQIGARIQF
jgi:hypothetical protein